MFSISAFFMKLKYNTILLHSGEDGSHLWMQIVFSIRRFYLPSLARIVAKDTCDVCKISEKLEEFDNFYLNM
jgi:hypothetical protein